MEVSSVVDAWIQPGVDEIDDQVDQDHHCSDNQNVALELGVIALKDRIERQAPKAGHREDRLDDDRAAQEIAELDAQDGYYRDQGVLERVMGNGGSFAEAFGGCG